MSSIKILFYWILLCSVIVSPQINLHFTDEISGNSDIAHQYDCLHIAASIKIESDPYQIISYCLTEWPTKWNISENNLDQKFTFNELYKQNITSQQLYVWSAPMDVVERYQLYLNDLLFSNKSSSMSDQLFYNCTSPRFGSLCQYSLDIDESYYSSLNNIIHDYYQQEYEPKTLTCYNYLKCNRGSTLACLDWSEICDGYIDCLNDGIDEKDCWQLEINECTENEYRCDNGQCIPKVFFHDDLNNYECLDRSDEARDKTMSPQSFSNEPTSTNEDITCSLRYSKFYAKLTSSCVPNRNSLLKETILLDTPSSVSETCWLAFKCDHNILHLFDPQCLNLCLKKTCKQIINETCPDLLFMPAGALVFGHIYLGYMTKIRMNSIYEYHPEYVCYNHQLCGGFHSNRTLFMFNNSTCRHPEDFPIGFHSAGRLSWIDMYLRSLYIQLYQCNTIVSNNFAICNSSTMYRCINSSKCITKHRLCDGKNDCDYKDDEYCPLINGTCSTFGSDLFFKCTTKNVCISSRLVGDSECDCEIDEYGFCDDEHPKLHYIRKHISFPTICDGFTELIPLTIDGRNETDETECDYWQCNNTYTRCDGFWNCFDGADEVDCDPLSLLKCLPHHHLCVSPGTYQLMCLPIEKANDNIIDCFGATDEPKLCRSDNYQLNGYNFHCENDSIRPCISTRALCSTAGKCMHGDDEVLCNKTQNNTTSYNICSDEYSSMRSYVQSFFCERFHDLEKTAIVHFSIDKIKHSTKQLNIQDHMTPFVPTPTTRQYDQRCHRGLPLRVWLNSDHNLTNTTCLCPPSFYGDLCQYQNQRVSLTMKFQTFSDSRQTLFALIVSLIDDSDERIIHSYQQLTYLYFHHCQRKFNVYLLYSTRPKVFIKNYSIQIDIYEKLTFAHRGSFLIPLKYPFLPVHRIAVQLNIPGVSEKKESCLDQKCIHGRCIKYSDDAKGTSFCQCDREWSGKYCTIPHTCTCSSDSLCVGVSANNRSICVCPLNKWGSLCLLQSTVCLFDQNVTCQNGGQCIPVNDNMVSDKKFICICRKGFSGDRCENTDNKIIISFDSDIDISQSILVHFIQVIDHSSPENGSTFKNIPINQRSVTIQWSRPFHIAFAELVNNSYYLITVQKIYKQSSEILKTINPSDRCKHISEVLNETIVNFPLLRRIKYYHLPCQTRSPLLSCFYDDNHFCLCNDFGHQRVANCFEFNSSIKHDCFGQSNCENGAQCLQDRPTCPQTSICVCPKCFYGTRCQFSSSSFGLSLDAILGYYIQPHMKIKQQPRIVQVSVALTTIIIIIGFFNAVASLLTFINKETQTVGCGFYLLGSSITSLLTVTMFLLKFWILMTAQMTYITNRSFLKLQCYSIDFLLRTCLSMDQWLSACIAMERAFITTKGANFNKKKSKQMAKYIICVLILLTSGTAIHDPIHRRLLDDGEEDDEKRIWCIITYSPTIQTFNTIMNIFHFFTPFIINIISAIIIIIMTTRQQSHFENHQSHKRLLRKQFHQHRHLLIAPILLIVLALPRLIISFISGCMKSSRDSWLSLFGYFVSFIPSMLCFVVFILPSKLYRKEFLVSIRHYKQTIRTHLHINSRK